MEEILNKKIEDLESILKEVKESNKEGDFNLKLEFKLVKEISRTKLYLYQIKNKK